MGTLTPQTMEHICRDVLDIVLGPDNDTRLSVIHLDLTCSGGGTRSSVWEITEDELRQSINKEGRKFGLAVSGGKVVREKPRQPRGRGGR